MAVDAVAVERMADSTAEAVAELAVAWADVATSVVRQRPPRLLTALCGALAAATPRWEELAPGPCTERVHRRLLLAPGFDAWLLAWPKDGATELHDHGGASGSFSVVAGTLHEVAGRSARADEHIWRAGPVVAVFGPAWVHDMVNLDDEVATSVHVYRPAITSMTYYERRPAGLRAVRVERVDDVPVVRLDPAA